MIEAAYPGQEALVEAWENGGPALIEKLAEQAPLENTPLAKMVSARDSFRIVQEINTERQKAYAQAVLEATERTKIPTSKPRLYTTL
ncbi:MAG: hypothetical protein L6Q57_05830 [Alphaproteobacteria bacterium]|nr:hypothetical protein [Alphaproteobacteria bacterium]